MNISKLLFKGYFVIWLLWLIFGIATNYKELATFLGYQKWTEISIKNEVLINCENIKINLVEYEKCLLNHEDYVTDFDANFSVFIIKQAFILAPLILLILIILIFYSSKMIFKYFKKSS